MPERQHYQYVIAVQVFASIQLFDGDLLITWSPEKTLTVWHHHQRCNHCKALVESDDGKIVRALNYTRWRFLN